MEVNEQAAAVQRATGKERRAVLLDLWESVKGVLYGKARRFWNAHRQSCAARGVELQDVESIAWEVFTDAVNAWAPGNGYAFITFLNYPFRLRTRELLNIRTERGRLDPLNNCGSLDSPLDGDNSDGANLHEVVGDPGAEFLDDLLEGLNTEQEAAAVRQAVEDLPEQLREIITRHYFDGQTLTEIAAAAGVSLTRIGQRKAEALRKLRGNRKLQAVCADRAANAKAAAAAAHGNDRAAALLSIYAGSCAALDQLRRDYEREMMTARGTAPEDSEQFTDSLAGVLSEYLTMKKA